LPSAVLAELLADGDELLAPEALPDELPEALLPVDVLAFSRMNTFGPEPCTRHPVRVIS
jgi:hypothetical protein